MTTLENAKVISEDGKKYVVETEEGKKQTLFKIDREKIAKMNRDSNMRVAEAFEKENISEAIEQLENILNDPPSVIEYEGTVNQLVENMKRWYEIVGSPNLFHHPIKNIDIEIYGKAHTLIKQVSILLDIMYEVAELMIELKKINWIRRGHRVKIDTEILSEEQSNDFLSTMSNWIDSNLIEVRHWKTFSKIS